MIIAKQITKNSIFLFGSYLDLFGTIRHSTGSICSKMTF